MIANERASDACVVQVDMRQQNIPDMAPRHALALESELERVTAARRPRIDERRSSGALDDRSGNRVRTAKKQEIDPRETSGKSVHTPRLY